MKMLKVFKNLFQLLTGLRLFPIKIQMKSAKILTDILLTFLKVSLPTKPKHENSGLQNFLFLLSLLTAPTVKSSHTYARMFFVFLRNFLKQT